MLVTDHAFACSAPIIRVPQLGRSPRNEDSFLLSPEWRSLRFTPSDGGLYLCPVCGRESFVEPPYSDAGSPSFEMCDCGFEFGFDDSPSASNEAVEGIEANWIRWRRRLIDKATQSSLEFAALEQRLLLIGRRIAFDLLDVPTEKTGEQAAS